MTKKCTQLAGLQRGSVSLLVILFGVIAIGICFGIVAVAETMTVKKEALLGAQSSANAAAFSYGQTYIKEVKKCFSTKVSEWLEEAPLLPVECDDDLLNECIENDFSKCDREVLVCIDDYESLVDECTNDSKVIAAATDAAKSAAFGVANNYQLKHFSLSKKDDVLSVSAQREFASRVPVLGRDVNIRVTAESETNRTKQGE